MSIDLAGIGFSEPVPLVSAVLPDMAGLYVLLVAKGHGAERSYEPICGGQVESLASRLRLRDDCIQDAVRSHPADLLYVAVHPFSADWTPGERLILEMRMRRAIEPPVIDPAFRARRAPVRIAAAYR
jgi:hypothetical protein